MDKKIAKKKGIVISDKMDKTIIVAVRTMKTHPKYLKKYLAKKKYKVHDPENKFKKGDTVEFVQCKPISKDKSHIVA
ncbi:MAG TPA: 30S ribosomal protein S17 [Candidatus Moranbacteria bacterium]|nr:30S ribosomal protein S17 [Candidatus Moranbacteria bacterium]HRZ33377.1 30S ribosomal protein S17 [Candidatus Moranbacteria bacterium]